MVPGPTTNKAQSKKKGKRRRRHPAPCKQHKRFQKKRTESQGCPGSKPKRNGKEQEFLPRMRQRGNRFGDVYTGKGTVTQEPKKKNQKESQQAGGGDRLPLLAHQHLFTRKGQQNPRRRAKWWQETTEKGFHEGYVRHKMNPKGQTKKKLERKQEG